MSSATKAKPLNADNLRLKAREMAAAKIADADEHGQRQAALFEILMQITKKEGDS